MSVIKLDKGLSIFYTKNTVNGPLSSSHVRWTRLPTLEFTVHLFAPILQIRYLPGHGTQVPFKRGQE